MILAFFSLPRCVTPSMAFFRMAGQVTMLDPILRLTRRRLVPEKGLLVFSVEEPKNSESFCLEAGGVGEGERKR